jgi:hypothetical protein
VDDQVISDDLLSVAVLLERFLFRFARWFFVFPAARTPILTCDRSRSSNLINPIVEEELGRAANLSVRTLPRCGGYSRASASIAGFDRAISACSLRPALIMNN